MDNLKNALNNFIEDVTTTEIAIIEKNGDSQKLLTYTRFNLDGDSVNFIDQESIEYAGFQKQLIKNAFDYKKALWKFITTASK